MASNNNLSVKITADSNDLLAELNKATGMIKGATSQIEGHFSSLGSVIGNLKAPIASIAAAVGGGALFGKAINDTIDFSKEVSKLSNVLGISKHEATALHIAIGDIYGDVNDFLGAASKFSKSVNSNSEAFKELGIRLVDNQGHYKNQLGLMLETLDGLSQYKGGLDKNTIAQELFGKSFQEVLKFQQLSIDKMLDAKLKVEELGLAMGTASQGKIAAYRAALNDVDDVFLAIKTNVSVELLPTLTTLANTLKDIIAPAIQVIAKGLNLFIQAMSYTTVQIALLAAVLYGPMTSAFNAAKASVTGFVETVMVRMKLAAMEGVTGFKALSGSVLQALNPWALAAAALVGIAVGIEYYSKSAIRAAEDQAKLNSEIADSIDKLSFYQTDLNQLAKIIESASASTENKGKALKAMKAEMAVLMQLYPNYFKNFDIENASYKDIVEKIGEVRKARIHDLDTAIETTREKIKLAQAEQLEQTKTALKLELLAGAGVAGFYSWASGLSKSGDALKKFDDALTDALKKKALLEAEDAKDPKKTRTPGKDSETELARLKRDLEAWKLQVEEKARLDGQYRQVSLKEEITYLETNSKNYRLKNKERETLDKELSQKKREQLKAEFDTQVATFDKEIAQAKGNVDKQIELAQKRAAAIGFFYGQESKEFQEALKKVAELDRARTEDQKKVYDARSAAMRTMALTTIDIQEMETREKRNRFEIGEIDFLKKVDEYEEKRYQIRVKALEDRLVLERLEEGEKAKIQEEMAALAEERRKGKASTKIQVGTVQAQESGEGGFTQGINEYLQQSKNKLQEWKNTALSIAKAVQDGFGNSMASILKGQMSLGQAMTAMYRGLRDVVIKSITDIIAKKMTEWALDKALAIWKKIRTGEVVAEKTTEMGANTGAAASGIFSAHSGIPFVGVALALGFIALMMTAMKQFTGRAVGGLVTKPEYTLLGEAGPEIVAPERDFRHYMERMYSDVQANQSRVNSYNLQAAEYSRVGQLAAQQNTGNQGTQHHYNMDGAFKGAIFVGSTRESMDSAAQQLHEMIKYKNQYL